MYIVLVLIKQAFRVTIVETSELQHSLLRHYIYISSLISLLHLTSHSPCQRRPLITGRKCLCNQLPGNLPLREVRKSDLEVSPWGHDIVYILCVTSVPTAASPPLMLLTCHLEGHL